MAELLLEFHAGILRQTDSIVTADSRQGTVRLVQKPSGNYLQWFVRNAQRPEFEVLLSSASSWERVPECPGARIYLLENGSPDKRHFFWMQETDEDMEMDKHISAVLLSVFVDPPSTVQLPLSSPESKSGNESKDENWDAFLQSFMAASQGSNFMRAQQLALNQLSATGLLPILDPDRVFALIDDEEALSLLAQFLPEGQQTRDDLLAQLRSPQFQQCVNRLTAYLNSEQYAEVMASMGLTSGADSFGVDGFLEAIQKLADDENKS